MVALMGASGSGKTTLMNLLGCLDRPTAGEYWLDGEEISELTPRAAGRRAQSQDRLRVPELQLAAAHQRPGKRDHAAGLFASTTSARRKRTARGTRLLELVGLGHRMDHHPQQMSGGQQQRVAIARALVNQPALLLADEPTGNLDSTTTEEILQTFRKLNDEEGLTIVIVTHEADVGQHCKRIVRMRDGRIEGRGPGRPRAANPDSKTSPADQELAAHPGFARAPGTPCDEPPEREDRLELSRLLSLLRSPSAAASRSVHAMIEAQGLKTDKP